MTYLDDLVSQGVVARALGLRLCAAVEVKLIKPAITRHPPRYYLLLMVSFFVKKCSSGSIRDRVSMKLCQVHMKAHTSSGHRESCSSPSKHQN